jgi:hypothetical protein
MSKIPPQIEARGLLAYEQARAFESLERKRPLLFFIYGVLALFCLGTGGEAMTLHRYFGAALALASGLFVALTPWLHWRGLRARYAVNLALLAGLKREYGEVLPWLEMERHFAALEKLQQELKDEAADPEAR